MIMVMRMTIIMILVNNNKHNILTISHYEKNKKCINKKLKFFFYH